jgi:hypothetical protein
LPIQDHDTSALRLCEQREHGPADASPDNDQIGRRNACYRMVVCHVVVERVDCRGGEG